MAGGGNSGGGGGTTIQKTEPWDAQKDYLTFGFGQAKDLYQNKQPTYYPGQTIASTDPATIAALNRTEQRAMSGSPVTAGATNLLSDTLSGSYLNSNPFLDKQYEQAARNVGEQFQKYAVPNMNSQFERAGRTGSSAQGLAMGDLNQQLGKQLSDMATNIYGQNYDQERQRQMQGLLFAPQAAAMDYADSTQLANVGAAREALSQRQLDEQMNKYNFEQNAQRAALQDYLASVQGNYGSSSTQIQNLNRGSPVAGILGGGLGGAMLGSQFFGPYGAMAGAGLGAIAGGFL